MERTGRDVILGADSCLSKKPRVKWGVISDESVCICEEWQVGGTSRRCGLLPNYFGVLFIIANLQGCDSVDWVTGRLSVL